MNRRNLSIQLETLCTSTKHSFHFPLPISMVNFLKLQPYRIIVILQVFYDVGVNSQDNPCSWIGHLGEMGVTMN